MEKVKVFKQTTNPNTFKTPIEELDELPFPPIIGHGLYIGSSKTPGKGIRTSAVTKVESNQDGYIVKTMNSIYIINREE